MSVYRYILETEYGYDVESQFLVILHGNQKKYRKEVTPYLKAEVEAVFKLREEQVLVEHAREAMDALVGKLFKTIHCRERQLTLLTNHALPSPLSVPMALLCLCSSLAHQFRPGANDTSPL